MSTEQLTVTDGAATGTHTYTVNGTFPITVTGDVTGKTASAASVVTLSPLALDVNTNATNPLRCEIAVTNIPASDTTLDGDWGDGRTGSATVVGNPTPANHNYTDAGTYTVVITAQPSGATATTEFTAVAPVEAV